jgi:predicted membrane-bound dolichyl-phosphate-mannose-protein mannosyltransferase
MLISNQRKSSVIFYTLRTVLNNHCFVLGYQVDLTPLINPNQRKSSVIFYTLRTVLNNHCFVLGYQVDLTPLIIKLI